MFDSIDQKSFNYLLGGTVTVFAGLAIWRYSNYLPRIEASWPALGLGKNPDDKKSGGGGCCNKATRVDAKN